MNLFKDDFQFTKRQLGLLCVGLGVSAFIGLLGLDLVTGGDGGIGPAQRIGLGLTVVLVLLGVTLLPLGDDKA